MVSTSENKCCWDQIKECSVYETGHYLSERALKRTEPLKPRTASAATRAMESELAGRVGFASDELR